MALQSNKYRNKQGHTEKEYGITKDNTYKETEVVHFSFIYDNLTIANSLYSSQFIK